MAKIPSPHRVKRFQWQPWNEDKFLSKEGSVLPWDKLEHFILAVILTALCLVGVYFFREYVQYTPNFTAYVIAWMVGFFWEIRDGFETHLSLKDLIANTVGIVLVAVVNSLFFGSLVTDIY